MVVDIIIASFVGLVPLSIVASWTYLRSKRIASKQFTPEAQRLIHDLAKENEELRERIGNLEFIVSDLNPEMMELTREASREKPSGKLRIEK